MIINILFDKNKMEFAIQEHLGSEIPSDSKTKIETYICELNKIQKQQKINGCPAWLIGVTFFLSLACIFLIIVQTYVIFVAIILFFVFLCFVLIDYYCAYTFKQRIIAISNNHRQILNEHYSIGYYLNSNPVCIVLRPVIKMANKVDKTMEDIPIFTLGDERKAKNSNESKKQQNDLMIAVIQENLVEQKDDSKDQLYYPKYRIPDIFEEGTSYIETNEFGTSNHGAETSVLEIKTNPSD